MSGRVLVVEDERPIADILQFNLEKAGFTVDCAYNGEDAVERARAISPDLIILDIMLPKQDGFAVCRELRRSSAVPIIMLTAKDDEIDKVLGLELGADDYVTKPFSPREVIARVKALLRRARGDLGDGAEQETVVLGPITIFPRRYEVHKHDQPLDLTFREYELLRYLSARPGQVFTRETLLSDVWGYEYAGDTRTVDVTVRRLREKLEDDPASPAMIHTKRGVGYYFQV